MTWTIFLSDMPHADYEAGLKCRREYQKTEAGKAAHAAANQRYRERNRKKLAAHNAVSKALARGGMVKWPACFVPECCLTEVEAHHPDYDSKLDVVWLCDKHHKETHALAKQLKGK